MVPPISKAPVKKQKMYRGSVCYECNHLWRDGSDASPTMRVGPSKSAYRRRLQAVASGVDDESSS
jgi:hypothetical protein